MKKILLTVCGLLFDLFIFAIAISVTWWLLKIGWIIVTQGIDGFIYKP
ncbi:hypothetical protein [uncultured Phascolarctobacterium sp.]|jgi:hypothetical protein|nr:hypothetical protein [uncultured Phascolarctobacterium sp.]